MPDWAIFALIESVSVASAVHLWAKTKDPVSHKLTWTAVALVPVLGPLFYGALHTPPPVHDVVGDEAAEMDLDPSDYDD